MGGGQSGGPKFLVKRRWQEVKDPLGELTVFLSEGRRSSQSDPDRQVSPSVLSGSSVGNDPPPIGVPTDDADSHRWDGGRAEDQKFLVKRRWQEVKDPLGEPTVFLSEGRRNSQSDPDRQVSPSVLSGSSVGNDPPPIGVPTDDALFDLRESPIENRKSPKRRLDLMAVWAGQ